MGPLGKVSFDGKIIPLSQGLGRPTRPSVPTGATVVDRAFARGATAVGGVVFPRSSVVAKAVGEGPGRAVTSAPSFAWQGRDPSAAGRRSGLA